jgi:dipeptidyl aminopeptidase/acylaminoacyl peptidase
MPLLRITIVLAGAVVLTTLGAGARPWTLADAVGAPFMDDVQLSPDGRQALVEIDRVDLAKDSVATSYSLIAMATGAAVALPADLTHPRWSPDSSRIAWLATDNDGTALAFTDPRGENRRTIPSGGNDVATFSWSPDGRTIAAVETARGSPSGGRLYWLDLESDYRGTHPPRRLVWLIDVESGAAKEVTSDFWSYGGPQTDHDPSWSADGSQIALVRQPTPEFGDFEHAQYVTVDVKTGAVALIDPHPFFAYPQSAAPAFGPKNAIAYARTWDGKLASREDVFVDGRDVDASLDRDLWSCSNGSLTWQSGLLVAGLLDGVALRLFALDPAGSRAPQALTSSDGSVVAYSIAQDGTIAYLWTTSQMLPELFVRAPGGATRQVTHLMSLPADLPIVPTTVFEWSDADGNKLHGLLTVPQGGAATAPLVIEPHGGPQCADPIGFSPIAQYLASNGYAYFRPDPPGSDGYGDWSYKAIVNGWGPAPMAADLAGIDALYAGGVGDRNRTYLEGGSYGGYLISWIVTHTDRFRAAVAEVPVTDLELEYSLSESPNILRRFYGERPATSPDVLLAQSPLSYVAQMHTPLLLIAGLRDTRAPYVQAIEFYKALADNGAPVRMIADPLAAHGPDDPQGAKAWWSAILGWFASYGGIALPDARLP